MTDVLRSRPSIRAWWGQRLHPSDCRPLGPVFVRWDCVLLRWLQMKRCPVCLESYAVAEGFCPMDGAPLLDPERPAWHGTGEISGALEPSEPDSLTGLVLDQRYRLEAHIGSGGMGVVYRATHVHIDKPFAIKVLRPEHADAIDLVKRFLLEARSASRIKHPNVVDISDFGELPDGSAYYVMEFLDGHTLAYEIDHNGKLVPERAVTTAIQAAQGLAAAHRCDVIHRDLKPDNVFLTLSPLGDGETVKLLDFGIAKIRGKTTRLTAAGAVVGTPEYMSPEQAQGVDVDIRSDLYALGVILFEMLTGMVPFRGDSVMATLTMQMFDAAPALQQVDPRLAVLPNIERVMSRLLAKDRDERPVNTDDAVQMLLEAGEADRLLRTPSTRSRRTVSIGSSTMTTDRGVMQAGVVPMSSVGSMPWGGSAASLPMGAATPAAFGPAKRPSVIVQGMTKTDTEPESHDRDFEMAPVSMRPSSMPLLVVMGAAAVVAAVVTFTVVHFVNAREVRTAEHVDVAASNVVDVVDTKVTLSFVSTPAGARVIAPDGREIGFTPMLQPIDRSDRLSTYVFRMPGHVDVSASFVPDRDQTVRAELTPLAPPSATPTLPAPAMKEPILARKPRPAHRTLRPEQTSPSDTTPRSAAKPVAPPKSPLTAPATRNPRASGDPELSDLKDPFSRK